MKAQLKMTNEMKESNTKSKKYIQGKIWFSYPPLMEREKKRHLMIEN